MAASYRNLIQQTNVISIPRENFSKLIGSDEFKELSRNDLKVYILLLTKLNSYTIPEGHMTDKRFNDPRNFMPISIEWIADVLDIKKKKVEESLDHLEDLDIIERGTYAFTSRGREKYEEGYRLRL